MLLVEFIPVTLDTLQDVEILCEDFLHFEKQFDDSVDTEWSFKNFFLIRTSQEGSYFYKLIFENICIGYFLATVKSEEEYRKIHHTLEIEDLYIIEKFRNQKVGFQIIEKLKQVAKLLEMPLSVKVSAKNVKALEFYRKLGFIDYDLILECSKF